MSQRVAIIDHHIRPADTVINVTAAAQLRLLRFGIEHDCTVSSIQNTYRSFSSEGSVT